MTDREIRTGPPVEIRKGMSQPAEIREADDGISVSGHAAVFDQKADIAGFFEEVIERGAFTEAIKRDDVVFLINHSGLPMARTGSETLRLSEDKIGLKMETVLDPADPDVKSIVGKMKRGDLDKMSFAFIPEIQEWDDSVDPPLRTIKKASLIDVSIVTNPAYSGTDIGLRSLEKHREKVRKERNFQAAAKRRRMKMDLAMKMRENGKSNPVPAYQTKEG